MDHYTIKLDGGKYTVINWSGILEFRRHGEDWPAAANLKGFGVVLAMVQRIEELEMAIGQVLNGSLKPVGAARQRDGLDSYIKFMDEQGYVVVGDIRGWQTRLRNVLEQKP